MSLSAVLAPPSESQEVVRVCCHCRRVWTKVGGWQRPVETPRVITSHGICRDCFVAFYPEFPPPDELG
jgi:hypothetical protein